MRSLEKRGLFDFEVVCPTPLPTAAVVVVDPFSSGSILAARVLHHKLRLVMVFSEVRLTIVCVHVFCTWVLVRFRACVFLSYDTRAALARCAIPSVSAIGGTIGSFVIPGITCFYFFFIYGIK